MSFLVTSIKSANRTRIDRMGIISRPFRAGRVGRRLKMGRDPLILAVVGAGRMRA